MARARMKCLSTTTTDGPIVTHTQLTGAAFRLEQLIEEREIEVAGHRKAMKAHRQRMQAIDTQMRQELATIARAREQACDGTTARRLASIVHES